jgi:hypothetical protein
MKFVSITPPKFDCEIFNEKAMRKSQKMNQGLDIDYPDKFMVLVSQKS